MCPEERKHVIPFTMYSNSNDATLLICFKLLILYVKLFHLATFPSRGSCQGHEVPRWHGHLPVRVEEAAVGEHRQHQGVDRGQPERRRVPLQGGLTGFTSESQFFHAAFRTACSMTTYRVTYDNLQSLNGIIEN